MGVSGCHPCPTAAGLCPAHKMPDHSLLSVLDRHFAPAFSLLAHFRNWRTASPVALAAYSRHKGDCASARHIEGKWSCNSLLRAFSSSSSASGGLNGEGAAKSTTQFVSTNTWRTTLYVEERPPARHPRAVRVVSSPLPPSANPGSEHLGLLACQDSQANFALPVQTA